MNYFDFSPNFPRLIGQFKLIAGTAIQALFKKAYIKIFDLQEHGVILISVVREKNGKSIETYYLIYRDVIIAEAATETQMQRAIAPFFGKNGVVLLGVLEEIVNKPNLNELIYFLLRINESTKATDLNKFGIQVLFRGTTLHADDSLFIGNKNSQSFGLSTSTDPLRAIVYGIMSATESKTPGVLQMIIPSRLENVFLQSPNYAVHYELEVILNIRASDLQQLVIKQIPIPEVAKLAKKFFNLTEDLPTKIYKGTGEHLWLMEESLPFVNLDEAFIFYQELIKL